MGLFKAVDTDSGTVHIGLERQKLRDEKFCIGGKN